MKHRMKQADLGGLLALLLFGVFAVCILSVLLTGADAYRRLTDRDSTSFERRTAVQYLETKLHQADETGSISAGSFDGCPALLVEENIDGSRFVTCIYCADGYLRELFGDPDGGFTAADGEKVTPAESLTVQENNGLLQLTVVSAAGEQDTVLYQQRSGVAQ